MLTPKNHIIQPRLRTTPRRPKPPLIPLCLFSPRMTRGVKPPHRPPHPRRRRNDGERPPKGLRGVYKGGEGDALEDSWEADWTGGEEGGD
jgi:hypothetical protein